MGQKVNHNLFEKHEEDSVKFMLYMFMMKLIGERIYRKYSKYHDFHHSI